MSKKLWIGLLFALVVCWIGLKPHLSGTAPEKQTDIAQLTDAHRVARWLQQHHRLPDFYLTKSAARRQGWNPAQGNLCEVLPGRAIGGDRLVTANGGCRCRRGASGMRRTSIITAATAMPIVCFTLLMG